MLKWSVSSISQHNSDATVDSIEMSERERLSEKKNGEVDEKNKTVKEGREIEKEVKAREEEENGGEEEEAGQLPAFRSRNYLVGGNSHLLSGNQQGRLGMWVGSDKCETSDLAAVAL